MTKFVAQVYKAFVDTDATLLEINPVLINGYGEIVAVDCKASMDENALYRHKDIEAMHDPNEDDATELEAKEFGLNYVNLDGNVGCMVNGAGLAIDVYKRQLYDCLPVVIRGQLRLAIEFICVA